MNNTTSIRDTFSGTENMTKINFILTCCLNVPVAIFGIFGNIFTLVMLVKKVIPGTDSLRLKLIHLTIADLCVIALLAVMMGVNINSYLNPVDGIPLLNLVVPYIMRSTFYIPYSISAYTLIFIAVERVIAIVKPFKVKICCDGEFVKVILAIFCVFSMIVCILKASEFKLIYSDHKSRYVLRLTELGEKRSLMKILEMFIYIVYFMVPFIITLLCNMVFVVSLLLHHRKMARMVADNNTVPHNRKKSKTGKMVVLLTALFFVTVVPSVVMRTYILSTGSNFNRSVRMGMTVQSLFQVANHCLNPVVYTITVPGYRRTLIQLVTFNRKGHDQSTTSS